MKPAKTQLTSIRSNVEETPLRHFDMLVTEVDLLCQIVNSSCDSLSRNPIPTVFHQIKELHMLIYNSQGFNGASFSPYILSQLGMFIKTFSLEASKPVSETSNHQRDKLSKDFLGSCIEFVMSPPNSGLEIDSKMSMSSLALSIVKLFIGSLLLFVPDRPFDPALRSLIEVDRHEKRLSEARLKLKALLLFEASFSGQSSSYRIRLAAKRLATLERPSLQRPIIRRPSRDVTSLYPEFKNILGSIVLQCKDFPSSEQAIEDGFDFDHLELVRNNTEVVISRLSRGFEPYNDITKPLIGMLRGLNLGLSLCVLIAKSRDAYDTAIEDICAMTPIMGASQRSLGSSISQATGIASRDKTDLRPLLLGSLTLKRSLHARYDNISRVALLTLLDGYYQEWKVSLEYAQKENAAKSSLFRYRGVEQEDNEDLAAQEVMQLFSDDVENPSKHNGHGFEIVSDPRKAAQRLACIHHEMFVGCKGTTEKILEMVAVASEKLVKLRKGRSAAGIVPVRPEHVLPGLVLELNKARHSLSDEGPKPRTYNFYKDKNIAEIRKLSSLSNSVRSRFRTLRDAWPENATIADVLKLCDGAQSLKYAESVAKALNKAEQLHAAIHEWQLVASREFTAVGLFDQLTQLIISWRRMELSTWSQLLDLEDIACEEDADAWWFVAYEVIIAAPMSIIQEEGDNTKYAEELFITLEQFLSETSLGQFSRRLRMLRSFSCHLDLLIEDHASLKSVQNALTNFLKYHSNFEASIQEALNHGRHALEKEVKDVLLFASWKDTNVTALRESAKRSHYKLFKVIRKYRTLLARPARETVEKGVSPAKNVTLPQLDDPSRMDLHKADISALGACRELLEDWDSRSSRFTNPDSTLKIMVQLSRPSDDAFDATAHLDAFSASLMNDISELQKETPAQMTDQNASMVKRLQARKRKLFQETLKTLRHMGFSSNPSSDVKACQSSTAKVLTRVSPLNATFQQDLTCADSYLHRVLDFMRSLRASTEYSEDLNSSEIARSTGLLESMLSLLIKQRTSLDLLIDKGSSSQATLDTMRSLWAPEKYQLCHVGVRTKTSEICETFRWIPCILHAGIAILDMQAEMSDINVSELRKSLEGWHRTLDGTLQTLQTLPTLPPGLSSDLNLQETAKAQKLLELFKETMQEGIQKIPNSAFVLQQILLWTESVLQHPNELSKEKNGADVDFNQFDASISAALDKALVAVQCLSKEQKDLHCSNEDSRWLLQTDSSLARSAKAVCTENVSQAFRDAVAQICVPFDSNGNGLKQSSAIIGVALPLLEQFCSIQQKSIERYLRLHERLCYFTSVLAETFVKLSREGFCSPSAESGTQAGESQKLDSGTGLGDGEAAEDISKDVQDDEDLSELAQQPGDKAANQDMDNNSDAVDMDHDELEGHSDDEDQPGKEEDDESDISENEGLEDEIDSVDGESQTALDEKLWDADAEEEIEEAADSKKDTSAQKGERRAAGDDESKREANETAEGSQAEEDAHSEEAADEDDKIATEQEELDPHLQEGQKLDLPEEMELEGMDGSESSLSADDSSESLSDREPETIDNASNTSEAVRDLDSLDVDDVDQLNSSDAEEMGDEETNETMPGSPMDTDPGEDEETQKPEHSQSTPADQSKDQDGVFSNEDQGVGEDANQIPESQEQDKGNVGGTKGTKGAKAMSLGVDNQESAPDDGETATGATQKEGDEDTSLPAQEKNSSAFKKLGDALEKWHRQKEQIRKSENAPAPEETAQTNTATLYEHLQHEDDRPDTQAMGAASQEQATALNDAALDSEMVDPPSGIANDDLTEDETKQNEPPPTETEKTIESTLDVREQSQRSGFIASERADPVRQTARELVNDSTTEDLDDLLREPSPLDQQLPQGLADLSIDDARRLWAQNEQITRDLSLALTERLRLILAPTLATKLRGDFRTGKRLNMKRIIPYIASSYKRDKIWMRRSIPSKRNYQIMLAVDDSKSMKESGGGKLALQALTLVAKSLTMLEAGELCIVGFGKDVFTAHPFDKPFTADVGTMVYHQFNFDQNTTDVRKLVADSIRIFCDARARQSTTTGTDIWQLELIISDGICEDHEMIKRLTQQAYEEQIMILFVIIDGVSKEGSIVDMPRAVFEPDPSNGGEPTLKMKRYLEEFPFGYYVVVNDVQDLPSVLSEALRQWFAEVADGG